MAKLFATLWNKAVNLSAIIAIAYLVMIDIAGWDKVINSEWEWYVIPVMGAVLLLALYTLQLARKALLIDVKELAQ